MDNNTMWEDKYVVEVDKDTEYGINLYKDKYSAVLYATSEKGEKQRYYASEEDYINAIANGDPSEDEECEGYYIY